LTLVAIATNFETKWAITWLVSKISLGFLVIVVAIVVATM